MTHYRIHQLAHNYTANDLADLTRDALGEAYASHQLQAPDALFWREQYEMMRAALLQRRATDRRALPKLNGTVVGTIYLRAEEIKDRCDVVDIVGRFVNLRKAGSHYKALCPFHDENTPSFIVFPTRGNWHCFGCGANGDVIDFMIRAKGLNYGDAVKELAAMAGIKWQMPQQRPHREIADL